MGPWSSWGAVKKLFKILIPIVADYSQKMLVILLMGIQRWTEQEAIRWVGLLNQKESTLSFTFWLWTERRERLFRIKSLEQEGLHDLMCSSCLTEKTEGEKEDIKDWSVPGLDQISPQHKKIINLWALRGRSWRPDAVGPHLQEMSADIKLLQLSDHVSCWKVLSTTNKDYIFFRKQVLEFSF